MRVAILKGVESRAANAVKFLFKTSVEAQRFNGDDGSQVAKDAGQRPVGVQRIVGPLMVVGY